MEKVTGIGGVFFKAQDPAQLTAWYREHLGIQTEDGHADFPWREKDHAEQIARTVWSIFPADTDYFGSSRMSPKDLGNFPVNGLRSFITRNLTGVVGVDGSRLV